jgi:2-dehydropantoate 2-reductase
MNIVVVGAGAMGCLFGGLLKLKGYDITLIDVSKKQIEAINNNGLSIETDAEKYLVGIPAKYAHEITEKAELIIVFTKTYHTKKAMESVKHLIGENTFILTVQNGLGNVEKVSEFAKLSRIIVGMTNHPCDLLAPGQIRSLGHGKTKIMSADHKVNPMLESVCAAFNLAGLPCEISPNVFCDIWEKVAFNVSLNSIGCVTYLTNGGIASVKEGVTLAERVAEEVVAVAKRKGIKVKRDRVLDAVDYALNNHKQHMGSMLQDVLAKRLTEIESLNGAVVREARNLGISVPATETLYLLVKIQEQTYDIQVKNNSKR